MPKPVMQVVLDTSVFANALQRPDSASAKVLAGAMRQAEFEIVMTDDLLQATQCALETVSHDKRDDRALTASDLLDWLQRNAAFCDATPLADIMYEADQQPAIAALLASGAACLVTADIGLASMHDQYNVVEPEEFLQQL